MSNFNIESVELRVKNMAIMKEYYSEKLKFHIISEEKDENNIKVTLGTKEKSLLVLISNGNEVERKRDEANVYHVAYKLPSMSDLGNFLRNAIKEKISLSGAGDHTVSEAIYMTDPEGNGIEIYSDRDKELWTWENGHVAMGTDEVNVEKLFEISDGMPEYVLPIGSVIGHVHLESHNLTEYKDFYINNLKLNITSELQSAYFLSHDNYHHHFGMNQWNPNYTKAKSEISTGVERIFITVSKDKYEEIFSDRECKKTIVDPNKIEINIITT